MVEIMKNLVLTRVIRPFSLTVYTETGVFQQIWQHRSTSLDLLPFLDHRERIGLGLSRLADPQEIDREDEDGDCEDERHHLHELVGGGGTSGTCNRAVQSMQLQRMTRGDRCADWLMADGWSVFLFKVEHFPEVGKRVRRWARGKWDGGCN